MLSLRGVLSCHCDPELVEGEAIFLDRHVPIPSGLAMTYHCKELTVALKNLIISCQIPAKKP